MGKKDGVLMPVDDWLRSMTDAELKALEEELEERAEQFDARTKQQVFDELQRRRLPLKRRRR